ncbi:MAG TPA: RICIN domain-containing protein [Polyangia bacterium]
MKNHALLKRTLRIGITLGAISSTIGCAEIDDMTEAQNEAVASDNGWSANGFSLNGFSLNGFSLNGFSANGFSTNGFSGNGFSLNGLSTGGLSSTTGLMTTPGGRQVVQYIAKCALAEGTNLVKQDQYGASYTFPGKLGVATQWLTGMCDMDCQEKVSACLLAHVNNAGVHISIWLSGEGSLGWGKDPNFPFEEGSFFGNLFPSTKNAAGQTVSNLGGRDWMGFYCNGKDWDAGSVPGRLGQPIATNVYKNPFGSPNACGWGSVDHSTNGVHDGFVSVPEQVSYPAKTWNHVVTVYRNFDPNTNYKICLKSPALCLGVESADKTLDGANLEVRSYVSGQTDMQWKVLQTTTGKYKLQNVASGKVVDVSTAAGKPMIQKPYTGSASQQSSLAPLTNEGYGIYQMKPSSEQYNFFGCGNSTAYAGQNVAVTNSNNDGNKWTIVPAN